MPSTVPTVCVRSVAACLLAASARGVDLSPVLAAHGVKPSLLLDPYARVPHDLVVALWIEVPALLGDDTFGLRAAEVSLQLSFDALDHATRHCATVGEAMGRMARYIRLLHDASEARVELREGEGRYVQHFHCQPPAPRHLCEFILARWVLLLRRSCGEGAPLLGVSFMHEAPADLREHRRVFGLPLRFGEPAMGFSFRPALLSMGGRGADLALGEVMRRHVEELLARHPGQGDLLAEARRVLVDRLASGPPSIAEVAQALRMSSRSLQRRLADSGTTFRGLLDETRRELALQHLRNPHTSLTEVALLTGFSDASAFHHAFRRWTGRTPREHRLAAEAGAS
jgi:AraC-like DNA-binding protein